MFVIASFLLQFNVLKDYILSKIPLEKLIIIFLIGIFLFGISVRLLQALAERLYQRRVDRLAPDPLVVHEALDRGSLLGRENDLRGHTLAALELPTIW